MEYECEFGSIQPMGVASASLTTEDGATLKCSCGKPVVGMAVGKESFKGWCEEHAPHVLQDWGATVKWTDDRPEPKLTVNGVEE